MVSLPNWDPLLQRLDRYGQTGNLPLTLDPKKTIEELARQVNTLTETVRLLVRHARQGPDWERSFRVSYEDVDAENAVTIVHDFGYTPGQFVVIRQRNSRSAATLIADMGGIRIIESDARTAKFQLDTTAIAEKRVFFVVPFRDAFVPPEGGEDGETARAFFFGSGGKYDSLTKGPIDHTV